MLVEQALFTSAQTEQARGYHLVARSPGIVDRLAQMIAVWGPTHDSLIDRSPGFESLNYFVTPDGWSVLSRTVYGSSEYSGRGGFRVETNLITLRREQLDGYGQNPLNFARMALALGHLRLRPSSPTSLAPIEVPAASLLAVRGDSCQDGSLKRLSDDIASRVLQGRVAVIGAPDALTLLANLLIRLPTERRGSLSFATGLKPSLHRKFDLQFLPSADPYQRRELAAAGMVCVDVQAA